MTETTETTETTSASGPGRGNGQRGPDLYARALKRVPPQVRCAYYLAAKQHRCANLARPGDVLCARHGSTAPPAKVRREELMEGYREQLTELIQDAIQTVAAKMTSPNHAVALRAALEVLDRNGLSTVRRSETHTTVTQRSELDERIEQLLAGNALNHRLVNPLAHIPNTHPALGSPPPPPDDYLAQRAERADRLGLAGSGVSDGADGYANGGDYADGSDDIIDADVVDET